MHSHSLGCFEVHEQQADLAGVRHVPSGKKHAIAVVDRKRKGGAVHHRDHPHASALVRDGGFALCIHGCEVEVVATGDEVGVLIVEFLDNDGHLKTISERAAIELILERSLLRCVELGVGHVLAWHAPACPPNVVASECSGPSNVSRAPAVVMWLPDGGSSGVYPEQILPQLMCCGPN